jgi:transcriptional regulator with XRE-family HTH domain
LARSVAILDGARVREELDRLNLTQREFAARVDLREATVSRAINGFPVDAETVFVIARGLGLSEPAR